MMRWQWHQQIICTSLQTDNHTSSSSLILTGRMLFLTSNQECQSIEGNRLVLNHMHTPVCARMSNVIMRYALQMLHVTLLWNSITSSP